jgi:hypothetical protein
MGAVHFSLFARRVSKARWGLRPDGRSPLIARLQAQAVSAKLQLSGMLLLTVLDVSVTVPPLL